MGNDNEEIKMIIKTALLIVNDLAGIDIENMKPKYGDETDKLEKLIKKAGVLKKNRLWKLN